MKAMDPKDYTGKEWSELARQLTPRQLRNSVKRAYRREAAKARAIAVQQLRSSGMSAEGDKKDLERSIRQRVYSRGGGFMVTVKAKSSGDKTQGMHRNRYGKLKPVLVFAEDGTVSRKTKTKTRIFTRIRKGHPTGSMPKFGILDKSTAGMFRSVETGLFPEVEAAVIKSARKSGII